VTNFLTVFHSYDVHLGIEGHGHWPIGYANGTISDGD